MSTTAVNISQLHSVSIRVRELRLISPDCELCFDPFQVQIDENQPFCCVVGRSGSGKTTFFKSLIPRFVEDWCDHSQVLADAQSLPRGCGEPQRGRFFLAANRVLVQKPTGEANRCELRH